MSEMMGMSREIIFKGVYLLTILILVSSLFLFPIKVQAATTYTQTVKNGIDAFPDSYKKLLTDFVANTDHTNWNFEAYYTGIDWNDFINGEAGKNRVLQSWDSAYQDPSGNLASGWFTANSAITAYFADPRNFINERNLFEFLDISYNPTLYTKDIVDGMIKTLKVFNYDNPITFTMDDKTSLDYGKQVTMTYSDIIMQAAKESQMSPISIVVKIVQEVGSDGSDSVSGVYPAYEGYYNFFNVGASDSGNPIVNGLNYAKNTAVSTRFPNGWANPYDSIIGGALFNSDDYIKAGQNTAYFYKFDCVGKKILNPGETQTITQSDLYHQYMTNVMDPYSQSWSLFNTYTNNNLLDKPLNFIIPVFNNMPDKVYKPSALSNSTYPLYYANVSSNLAVRSNATSSFSIIMTLYKDDLVAMLQRNYATVGGTPLDQVQLWNGQIGYIATEYLEPFIKEDGSGSSSPPVESPDPSTPSVQAVEPNIGFGYANVSSSLNVRSSASSTATVVASAMPNEQMIILEDLASGWYKVKLSSGKIGYVMKDYVVKIEKIKVSDKQIIITPDITADYVAGRLNVNTYTIKNGETAVTGNVLCTGYKFVSGENEYDIVKLGDITGKGDTKSADYIAIKNYIMGTRQMTDIEKKAADVNMDGNVTSADYIVIKNYIMGKSGIIIK